jgi:hypothetical protein
VDRQILKLNNTEELFFTVESVHSKPNPGVRDMFGLYIKKPVVFIDKPLYFVLNDENKVDVVEVETGIVLRILVENNWTSRDPNQRGYMVDVRFSFFVIVVR